jgi:hypothetical protein
MNDVQENAIVFLVSDYESRGVVPATAPSDWATTYAIANSTYLIEDANGTVNFAGKKFKALSASDAAGTNWDTAYAGKLLIQKA